jgi:hypothetical protein
MDLRVSQQGLATVRAHQADHRKHVCLRFLSTQARDDLASVVWFPTLWTSEIVVQAAKHRFTPVRKRTRAGNACRSATPISLPDPYTETMAQNVTADKSKFDSPARRDAKDSAPAEGGQGGSEAPIDFRNSNWSENRPARKVPNRVQRWPQAVWMAATISADLPLLRTPLRQSEPAIRS